jgi:hypothetical protein
LSFEFKKLSWVYFELKHLRGLSPGVTAFPLHSYMADLEIAARSDHYGTVAVKFDHIVDTSQDPARTSGCPGCYHHPIGGMRTVALEKI